MYALLIIWDTGERQERHYNTEQDAKAAEFTYRYFLGDQILYTGITSLCTEL